MMTVKPYEMRAGDRFTYRDVACLVIEAAVKAEDTFGRAMLNVMTRRLDTGEEGFVMYGPTAEVKVERHEAKA